MTIKNSLLTMIGVTWRRMQILISICRLHLKINLCFQPFCCKYYSRVFLFTVPSRINVTSRQLIFWEFSTRNSVISATTFIKNGPNFTLRRLFKASRLLKSRNQVVQLPATPLFQPLHHSKLENVFDFYIKVWRKNC